MSSSDSDRFEELSSSSSSSSQSTIPKSNSSKLPTISISKPESQTDEEEEEEEEGSLIFHDTVTDPIEHLISSIEKLKTNGNLQFSRRDWQKALNSYNEALLELPPIGKSHDESETQNTSLSLGNEGFSDDRNDGINDETHHEPRQGPSNENKLDHQIKSEQSNLDPRLCNLRATLNANSAACHLKLEDWKSAVEASTASLRDDPAYQKALHRRAQGNEKLDTWASLQAALDDYNTLANLPDLPVSLLKEIRLAQARLPLLISERSEKEKAEMMDKLKTLGNTVLGKFGLSTDHFKFTPNETGGYSMSFER
ncbi:uncharacterized protein MELLADRAFT_107579 [Melampsora larici-populina 98AG31]|uniref:TPR repeat-containing protein n=1 Tax=Melampsora larici-populina (strain 98AG31 / pathotype 3-4-7) TaxID=747676 RepID=F4RQ39_MELLP|nr:uncharacterized protein MELLADRAFT_107579 [Melampsora larici-populina 98AG31]EGG05475.1 hypothetical protein MELLADRAFT_107579 [Melampsora larici-populina 98AG31]